jgi:hypothetical protein
MGPGNALNPGSREESREGDNISLGRSFPIMQNVSVENLFLKE